VEKNWRQIEGKNPVLEALKASSTISKIFMQEGLGSDERISEIQKLARKKKIPIIKKGWKNINRLSVTQSHQGIIAYATPIIFSSLAWILEKCQKSDKDPLVLILPEVLYEYNLGAIIRTCEGAGIDCLLLNRRNRLGAGVSRSSMGAVEYLPLVQENLFASLNLLKKSGVKIVAALEEAETNYFDADLTGPLALVVGSEHKGISDKLLSGVDQTLKIPMKGKIQSLNMSVAAAIILYEILRQRRVKNKG